MSLFGTQDILQSARDSMKDYSHYVIVDRAIPDFRDGLKPVHRAILWSMHESGLNSTARYVKGAKVVGDTMANYHPHGDGSIDGSLVRMSQSWVNMVPLTDIHGNNGNIDGSGAAAMRYYECRQSESADLLTQNIQKNAVNLLDNFDGTRKMPEVLPAAIPQGMINGSKGIALGMATNILPHNPLELLDASIALVKKPETTVKALSKIVKGPDFPTGGSIIDNSGHLDEIENGRGKFIVRGKVILHTKTKEPYLEIVEVPWGLNTTALVDSIVSVLDNHAKALGVVRVDNESASSMDISIKVVCKKGTSETTLKQIENLLYKKSKLQQSFSANNVMIVESKPACLGIREYLLKFNEFRLNTLKRIWQFDLDKLKVREHAIEGLLKLVKLSDEVVKDARNSESRKHFVEILQKKHKFSADQSELIANLPLYRLGKQDFEQLTNELSENQQTQANLTSWLTNEEAAKAELLNDLQNSKKILKNYKRRTEFLDAVEEDIPELELKAEDLVESKPVKVIVKRDLQVFRMGPTAYKNNIDKYDNDDIVQVLDSTTSDYVVIGTKSGQSITRFVNDLDQGSLTGNYESLNKQIPNLLASDELVGAVTSSDFEQSRLLVITKQGAMKLLDSKSAMPSVNNRRYITKLGKFMKFKNEGDEVIFSAPVKVDDLENLVLTCDVLDTEMKNPKARVKEVLLGKYKGISDGAGSSGRTLINTKNGRLKLSNFAISSLQNDEDMVELDQQD